MLGSKWQKVFADLWGNKVRSGLMLLTITVSVFAVGFIISTGELCMSDMDADFQGSNGHSAIIYTSPSPDLEHSLAKVPGVADVEQRSGIDARWVLDDTNFQSISIISIPQTADALRIDRLKPIDPPAFPDLPDRQVLLTDSAVSGMGVKPGDSITIELSNEKRRSLKVAGIVHDVYAIPPMFGGAALGYVTPATVEWLGGSRDFTQVYMTVSESPSDREHVTSVSQAVADKIRDAGVEVGYTFIYNPGRHFAKDIFKGIMMILYILGGMTVFLGTFLVINIINALLNQHVRYIGVMKAIGGQRGQIIGMYAALVLCLGVIALLLSSWSAGLAGYYIEKMMGGMLNFIVGPFRFSPAALGWQAVIALSVPILAALAPIWNGTRITVREAISSYGLGKGPAVKDREIKSRIDRLAEKCTFLSRPLLLSLRNTFGRKSRLVLTLITLTLAGATFISVFNLWASFRVGAMEVARYFLSDVTVYLEHPYNLNKMTALANVAPNVDRIEGWDRVMGQLLSPDEDKKVDVGLYALPNSSTMVQPLLTSGRWLLPTDENAIVIGNHILNARPELKVGDSVVIEINEKEFEWKIVGTFRLLGNFSPAPAYVNYDYLARVRNTQGTVSILHIVTAPPDGDTEARVAGALETIYKRENIQISEISQGEVWLQQQLTSFDVMIYFLMVMAVLIAVVGGLGLMGTMSMNVMERSREIGVLRSMGAQSSSILQMVLVEVTLIGLISWALAFALSVPITYVLNIGVGLAVFTMPLDFHFGFDGVFLWLGGVLVISILAGAMPAANAIRLTIREVLAYE